MEAKAKLPPPLLLRADADSSQGTGHVMRCLALAQEWQAHGGRAIFISRCHSAALRARVEASGAAWVALKENDSVEADLQITLARLSERQGTLLVLDGYHFDARQQQAMKIPRHPLLVIDDNAHLPTYHADILLNQNLGAGQLDYHCAPDTVLLLGPSYALLRPEFQSWRRRLRCNRTVGRRVLVTMGGSDPNNFTLRVIDALARLDTPGIEARVVLGSANRHVAIVERAVAACPAHIELLHGVNDMAALMGWADFAVSAAGSTCWELVCLGLPAVVVSLAENQRRIADELDAAGVAQNLGWHESVTAARLAAALENLVYASFRRFSMSEKSRWLVDGRGTERVVQALIERSLLGAA